MKNNEKNMPRIYVKDDLQLNQIYCLSKDDAHHIKTVLRMKIKDILQIFNNTDHVFFAQIIDDSHKNIKIKIFKHIFKSIESPLHIHLGQVVSSNDKMDFTIQKSIEMGVNIITPLLSDNCHFQKKMINIEHKIKRWKKIAVSACQQCHRNTLPIIHDPKNIFSWCKNTNNQEIKIIFHPQSLLTMNNLPQSIKYVSMIIGSEKGFSNKEIQKIMKYGFIPIKLGPRILRTETASIAAITALQIKFGDLSI